ncbi:MAG: hypothetical protein OEZ54_10455, partial [Gemmatimonadota bacterium]|nr:hypothetical protein [Gemmatimonadota bacterium]
DVTIPSTDAQLIVSSVIVPSADSQFVIVEFSANGTSPSNPGIYGGSFNYQNLGVTHPVRGARVAITHVNPRADCLTPTVNLDPAPPAVFASQLVEREGVYVTDQLCPLLAGDSLRLLVEVGESQVKGVTQIPRIVNSSVGLGPGLDQPERMTLHRELDSVWIDVQGELFVGMQLEVALFDPLSVVNTGSAEPNIFFSDNPSRVLAGDSRREGVSYYSYDLDLFAPGRVYEVVAGLADRNFYDFVNSGGDLFTGQGFVNHLEGGYGVFGSMMTTSREVGIVGPQYGPNEGTYHVTGLVDGQTVDLVWEVFDAPDLSYNLGPGSFSALIQGTWRGTPVYTYAVGGFNAPYWNEPFAADLRHPITPADSILRFIGTPAAPGTPFMLEVQSRSGAAGAPPHTLTAVQLTSAPDAF